MVITQICSTISWDLRNSFKGIKKAREGKFKNDEAKSRKEGAVFLPNYSLSVYAFRPYTQIIQSWARLSSTLWFSFYITPSFLL